MNKNSQKILCAFVLFVTMLTAVLAFSGVMTKDDAVTEAVVLKQGSTGNQVKTVQTKLKRWGYYTGAVDGIYGAATTKAVKYFQSKNGLTADGIVGKKTAAAMGISLSTGNATGSSSGYSSSDEYLLAKCVYAEARGEPYVGQVAVAAVVLNRVKSASFPNTIAGVIYQPWAFTAVNDGQINLSPNATAIKAAKDALNGWLATHPDTDGDGLTDTREQQAGTLPVVREHRRTQLLHHRLHAAGEIVRRKNVQQLSGTGGIGIHVAVHGKALALRLLQ